MASVDLSGVFPADRPYETIEGKPYQLFIAGFWSRILADLIDLGILAVLFLILALVFRSFFFRIGPYGRLVGFGIAVGYFTLFSSRLTEGQSLGKRLTKITVRDKHGYCLSLKRSLGRSVILLTILLFNGWELSIFVSSPAVRILAGTIVFGGLLVLLYGYIFNRSTRQGPHDLIVGSYVTQVPAPYSVYDVVPGRQIHKVIPIGIMIFVLAAATGLIILQKDNSIVTLQSELVKDKRFWSFQTVQRGSTLEVYAWDDSTCEPPACNELINDIAMVAVTEYDDIHRIEDLSISIYNRTGLDFGLTFYVPSTMSKIVYNLHAPPQNWINMLASRMFFQGLNKVEQQDYLHAIEYFTQAIELNPTMVIAFAQRALAYYALEDYQHALDDLYKWKELAGPLPEIDAVITDIEENYIERNKSE